MREGDVALAVLPQVDERAKSRPVVVLREMPRYGDVLVCGISTRLSGAGTRLRRIDLAQRR